MLFSRKIRVLLFLPALLAFVLTFVLPFVNNVRMSLSGYSEATGIDSSVYTLAEYKEIFSSSYYLEAWLETMRIAAVSAVLTTVVGSLIAYGVWSLGGRARGVVTTLIIAPLFVSGVVRAYGWIAALGTKGILPSISGLLGLGPWTVNYGQLAVVIGFVHALLPYAILAVLGALDGIDRSVLRASASVGAGPFATATRVVLPLAAPGALVSFMLTFVLASSAYTIPAILGGNKVTTASEAMFEQQNVFLDWPAASALSIVLALVILVLMVVYQRLTKRIRLRVEAHGI